MPKLKKPEKVTEKVTVKKAEVKQDDEALVKDSVEEGSLVINPTLPTDK
jgi:hypothetical protein